MDTSDLLTLIGSIGLPVLFAVGGAYLRLSKKIGDVDKGVTDVRERLARVEGRLEGTAAAECRIIGQQAGAAPPERSAAELESGVLTKTATAWGLLGGKATATAEAAG